jgi:hypothetical protein
MRVRDRGPAASSEQHGIIEWRSRQLMQSGFERELAASVAADFRFDLHALIELVERGCAPELAVRILAPLSDPVLA